MSFRSSPGNWEKLTCKAWIAQSEGNEIHFNKNLSLKKTFLDNIIPLPSEMFGSLITIISL